MSQVRQNYDSENLVLTAVIYSITYAKNLVLWKNQALINIAAEKMLLFLANTNVNFSYK
jgi:hypothetical protein